MKIMKFFNYITIIGLFFGTMGCGDKAGNISLGLEMDAALVQADLDNIEHFVFVVSNSNESLLYPSDCLGKNSNGADCIQVNTNGCGFLKSEAEFKPRLDFNKFPEGQSVDVQVCALDASNASIAEGQSSLINSDGQSATITLSPAAVCTSLPPNC